MCFVLHFLAFLFLSLLFLLYSTGHHLLERRLHPSFAGFFLTFSSSFIFPPVLSLFISRPFCHHGSGFYRGFNHLATLFRRLTIRAAIAGQNRHCRTLCRESPSTTGRGLGQPHDITKNEKSSGQCRNGDRAVASRTPTIVG